MKESMDGVPCLKTIKIKRNESVNCTFFFITSYFQITVITFTYENEDNITISFCNTWPILNFIIY